MTPSQFERVFFALRHYRITRGFHGACHGADREFHGMVHVPMELFPCDEKQHQWALATCAGGKDVIHPIDVDPIRRNHRIVDCCSLLVAAPGTSHEVVRGSGTWATIRYSQPMRIWSWPCRTPSISPTTTTSGSRKSRCGLDRRNRTDRRRHVQAT